MDTPPQTTTAGPDASSPAAAGEPLAYDVAVAGGGVGGLALATRLARAGHRVAVVERTRAGTFRVGESLDWEAPVFLGRLGFDVSRWVEEGKATFKGGAVVSNVAQPRVRAEIGFAAPFRFLMTLVGRSHRTIHANREMIDIDLFDAARAAGADLLSGKVRRVEHAGEAVDGLVLDDGRGLRAKYYVDATGASSLFRRTFGIGQDDIGPRKVVVRARFEHLYDGLGTRIRTDDTLSEPAWIWDINVSDRVTDIGIVVAERDFAALRKRLGSVREVFLHQCLKHDDLDWVEALVDEDTELWTCSFQDMVSHRSSGPNWIAVGEAAFVVDAILSSGFTMSLRTGFRASDLIGEALARNSAELDPLGRRIYHEKTRAQVRTIDGLIDVLWYRGRLREHYSLMLNVVSILFFNFNLNHLHTRFTPRSRLGLRALLLLHAGIDRFVRAYDRRLQALARRRGRWNPHFAPAIAREAALEA
ncbi:MAG TPA: tryptophan 7-halogenase [Myxococcota bacterium]|nr:tryptophan 7-halogenase [Myxococcota bacterium]